MMRLTSATILSNAIRVAVSTTRVKFALGKQHDESRLRATFLMQNG